MDGLELDSAESAAVNWIDLVGYRRATSGASMAFGMLLDGESTRVNLLNYAALDVRARAIASHLQRRVASGAVALLLYPPGLEFICAFFGCLYAGIIAIPFYPLHRRKLQLIATVAQDAAISLILSDDRHTAARCDFTLPEVLAAVQWISTETVPETEAMSWERPHVTPSTLAYLQYTSGSTSLPKGVMISHRHALAQCRADSRAWRTDRRCTMVSWMPHFHDFGLVFGLLQPLYTGFPCYLMPPAAFAQRPIRWLRAISTYRATHSGTPSFAFDLCTEKITSEELADIDLGSWVMAPVGAEPVREQTLQNFSRKFARCGFKASALYPSYGLAEATLRVTCGPWRDGQPRQVAAITNTVSCGRPEPQTVVKIVDPKSHEPLETGIGEVWVAGDTIAQGYWRAPQASSKIFDARLRGETAAFLRTGDLGFLHDGELYLCGRLKDVIVVRGANFHPQDIEIAVEQAYRTIRAGHSAVFAIERGGEECIVVLAEIHRSCSDAAEHASVMQAIRKAISQNFELSVAEIRLLRSNCLPLTSGGKKQRARCKQLFMESALNVLASWSSRSHPMMESQPLADESTRLRLRLREGIVRWICEREGLSATSIDCARSLTEFGLSSMDLLDLYSGIREITKTEIDPQVLWETPSITALIDAVVEAGAAMRCHVAS